MNNQTNQRSKKDRRTTHTNATVPLRDSQGIIVALNRHASCGCKSHDLEFTEINLSQKVFQAALKKFPLRFTQTRDLNTAFIFCLLCLTSFSFASESEGTIPSIITPSAEPLHIVLLCPEGSQHEGELVPKWITNDETTDYFCNDSTEDAAVVNKF